MPQRTYINVIQETAFSLVQLPYSFAMFQSNPPGKRNIIFVCEKRQKEATNRQSLQYIFMIWNIIYMVHVIKIIPNFNPPPGYVSFAFTKYTERTP